MKGPQAKKSVLGLNSSAIVNSRISDVPLEVGGQEWFSESKITRYKLGNVDDHKEELKRKTLENWLRVYESCTDQDFCHHHCEHRTAISQNFVRL